MKNNKVQKKKDTNPGVSRREFLGTSAVAAAGFTILPSFVLGGKHVAPSDRVVMGFIGCGQQSINDFRGFAGVKGIQVAACADVDSLKTERFKKRCMSLVSLIIISIYIRALE